MRTWRILIMMSMVAVLIGCAPKPDAGAVLMSWAYPQSKNAPNPPTLPEPVHVPGSNLAFTNAQLSDDKNPADWFPDEHPPPPPVVAHEREGGSTPCAECHLYNGRGFIAAADLAGLSAPYIIQQVQEFRAGRRMSAQHDRFDVQEMVKVAGKVSDPELAQAAAYFAALPRTRFVRVVEADAVPVTKAVLFGWLEAVPNGGTEPIKGRIIEVSEDMATLYLGDAHIGLVDYVPPGAVARGEALAKSGGKGGQPCAACHGPELKGAGDVPPLAGRAASYLARMLWDIRSGARNGPAVAAMQTPAKGLTEAEITDVVAYLASRTP